VDAWLAGAGRSNAWLYWALVMSLVVAEWLVPRRRASASLSVRWANNVALGFLGGYLLRWAVPLAGLGWALVCQQYGWGVFNRWPAPAWLELVVTLLAFDLMHYVQHRSLHAHAWLWRAHRTHHSDQDFDFTTALRFHPLEVVITALVLAVVTTLLGASPLAVVLSQLLGMVSTFIEHANLRLPSRLDGLLRAIVVTPDMHAVHHSQAPGDTRANLSTTFSFWDRLFGTYRAEPRDGYERIVFGLEEFKDPKHLTVHWMLAQPFLRTPTAVLTPPLTSPDRRQPTAG